MSLQVPAHVVERLEEENEQLRRERDRARAALKELSEKVREALDPPAGIGMPPKMLWECVEDLKTELEELKGAHYRLHRLYDHTNERRAKAERALETIRLDKVWAGDTGR